MTSTSLFLLVLFYILKDSYGMTGSKTYSPSDPLSILWSFEFQQGGILNASIIAHITNNNQSIQVFICSDNQLKTAQAATMEQICASTKSIFDSCVWKQNFDPKQNLGNINIHASSQDWYNLVQVNCQKLEYELVFNYWAQNPNGEFLSLSQIPYKYFCVCFCALWAGISIIWSIHCYRYRMFNVSLHLFLLSVSAVQVVYSLYWSLFWNTRSMRGVDYPVIDYLAIIIDSFNQGYLLLALFILSEGYGILYQSIERKRFKNIMLLVFALAGTTAVYDYFKGFLVFLVVLIYCISLRIMFTALLSSSSELLKQIYLLREAGFDGSKSPAAEKHRMLKKFQSFTVGYLCINVIFQLWAKIFLQKSLWICDLVSQTLLLLYSVCILRVYRMRPFYPRLWQFSQIQESDEIDEYSDADDEFSIYFHSLNVLWKPGDPDPNIPMKKQSNDESSKLLLVENPPTLDERGKKVDSFSIAHKIM
jgi:hypothetical protein